MTRRLLLAFTLLLASCPAPTTSVRLRLQYDDTWPLTAFVVTARDKTVRLHAASADGTKTREFILSIPPEWVGDAVIYNVRAYVGVAPQDELYAAGFATATAIEGEVVDYVIDLNRSPCATWCAPGATSCRNGGVTVCERSDTGCPRWGTPSLCSDGQSCSLGECSTECVNECAEGEARCSGPLGVEICGQSDDDTCLDWQHPILCEGAQVCSNGRCSDSCASECTPGAVRCRDGGVSTCADSNEDGCYEWGPSAACSTGQSCTGNEGTAGTAGAAQCQERETCTDLCTASSCANNTFTTCGNFNGDACREPSAGTNCASNNPCQEGVCDLTANGGMGGCVIRPRTTPECTGQCAGLPENSSCNDNEACSTGDSCRSGVCTGTPMNCTAGREPTCENSVARTYAMAGMCMNGTCQHSVASEETCRNGCDGTRCAAAPVVTDRMQIAVGLGAHNCALLPDQTVRCWGRGWKGELGNGRSGDQYHESVPVTVMGLSNVTAITVGGEHSCALQQNSTVRCWGRGSSGQLGNGTIDQSVPVPVMGLSNVTAISAGISHTCALLQDRTVRCWGEGRFGQLGNNGTDNQSTPVAVEGLNNVDAIAAGGAFTCALLQDDSVRCWGIGDGGQLGNGSIENASTPLFVLGLTNVSALSAGGRHACALLHDGTARCWGAGDSQRLGSGSSADRRTAVMVVGLSSLAGISAGGFHTCARLQDGTVRCWGRGDSGQLGDGSFVRQSPPVATLGLSNVVALFSGVSHTCALLQDSTVRCWGRGHDGQLGNNSTADESTPVTVLLP